MRQTIDGNRAINAGQVALGRTCVFCFGIDGRAGIIAGKLVVGSRIRLALKSRAVTVSVARLNIALDVAVKVR
jgi:hypothetical protein